MLYLKATIIRLFRFSFWLFIAALFLYVLADTMEQRFTEHGDFLKGFQQRTFWRLPLFLYRLTPFLLLFAPLFLAMKMSRSGETLFLASSGQGKFRRLFPFLLFGLVSSGCFFLLGEYVVPHALKAEKNLKTNFGADEKPKPLTPDEEWISSASGLWRIGEGTTHAMKDVILYRADRKGRYGAPRFFQKMEWSPVKRHWIAWETDETRKLPLKKVILSIAETPEHFTFKHCDPEALSIKGLKYIEKIRSMQGKSVHRYIAARWQRIGLPLVVAAMPLLALAVAWRRTRGKKGNARLTFGLLFSLALTVALFLSISITTSLAEAGLLPEKYVGLLPPTLAWLFAFYELFTEAREGSLV